MYNSIVYDHLCDTWLPTFETLSFFAYNFGTYFSEVYFVPQVLLQNVKSFLTRHLNFEPIIDTYFRIYESQNGNEKIFTLYYKSCEERA